MGASLRTAAPSSGSAFTLAFTGSFAVPSDSVVLVVSSAPFVAGVLSVAFVFVEGLVVEMDGPVPANFPLQNLYALFKALF